MISNPVSAPWAIIFLVDCNEREVGKWEEGTRSYLESDLMTANVKREWSVMPKSFNLASSFLEMITCEYRMRRSYLFEMEYVC